MIDGDSKVRCEPTLSQSGEERLKRQVAVIQWLSQGSPRSNRNYSVNSPRSLLFLPTTSGCYAE